MRAYVLVVISIWIISSGASAVTPASDLNQPAKFLSAAVLSAQPVYYIPSCNLICYAGCTSKPAPIVGNEFLLPYQAGDMAGVLFANLPAPFETYKVAIVQGYESAVGGQPNYSVEMNIESSAGAIVVDRQVSVSLDKFAVGGQVAFDLDLQPSSSAWLRAECSLTRSK